MKTKFFTMLLAAGLTVAGFQSCRKDKIDPEDNDITMTEDNALAENTFNDAFDIMEDAARDEPGLKKKGAEMTLLTDCAEITLDTADAKKKLTVDFKTGCVGKDGRTRMGKIICEFNGKYHAKDAKVTFTFKDYKVNSLKDPSLFHTIEGNKSVTYLGPNDLGQPQFKIEVDKSKLKANGKTIEWTSTRTRTWVAGYNTPSILDDEYEITGTTTGTSAKGQTYTLTITKPLHVKVGCRYITSGTIEVKPSGKLTRTVDYGNGDCDADATVTIGGRTYNFQMK